MDWRQKRLLANQVNLAVEAAALKAAQAQIAAFIVLVEGILEPLVEMGRQAATV